MWHPSLDGFHYGQSRQSYSIDCAHHVKLCRTRKRDRDSYVTQAHSATSAGPRCKGGQVSRSGLPNCSNCSHGSRPAVRLAADSSPFDRAREPRVKCRCVCRRAEAIANRTRWQVDVHVPVKGVLIEPREHLHGDLIERQRHLVGEVPIDSENHAHSL
jgi:hypothetical protein